MAPSIFVNAQQAALLFAASAPMGREAQQGGNGGGTRAEGDGAANASGGNGRSGDDAQPAGQVPIANAVSSEPLASGGSSPGSHEGDSGEAAGTSVGGG